jgi:polysaccharide pyruvyl transferase WcaK-like protein
VSADLAFALREPQGHDQPVPGRLVVGVMTPDARAGGERVISTYAEKMALAIVRLLDRGHSVRLVVGDLADQGLAVRIARLVGQRRPHSDDDALGVSDADTLSALMTEMAQAEVVVASRFHNLVCALMVRRPAVSLGYAAKNAELLADFGLVGYDQPMRDFDVDLLERQVQELRKRRVDLEPEMTRTLERVRAALVDQYREFDEQILGLNT